MGFDSVLVANRGEIACRIISSARRLGLKTIAVFSEADRGAPHVRAADVAVPIGEGPARDSYLRAERVLDAAADTGAGAVHPGYGFLSESADFAETIEREGICFVGPTPNQLRLFGQKHTARAAATAAGVALLPGSGLIAGIEEARAAAAAIGYPVMVKATSGGGGIGMQVCDGDEDLERAIAGVARVAAANFGEGGVYLEAMVPHARHIEVQLFGDGDGRVLTLGDRDCTLQRRNQKVIEEAPAPNLPDRVRDAIAQGAVALGSSVNYRSAGTVEYLYDAGRGEAFFLEVNTRLQVEHGVTESIFDIDLVEWMFRLAQGESEFLGSDRAAKGHAIEARLYAEDPTASHRPSAGLLTEVSFPVGVRVDTWIEAGTEVSSFYDPLLAKIIATGTDRDQARSRLDHALGATRVEGIVTNLGLLRVAIDDGDFERALHSTTTLDALGDPRARIEVVDPGTMTTVQDWPGRLGYWMVGVPPSGPMDDLSFRLGNVALGNDPGTPGLEAVLHGPTLRCSAPTRVCVTGASAEVRVDGQSMSMWSPFLVGAGSVLEVGPIGGPGMRTYVLFGSGLDVPAHLGSASTFTLGVFGGHGGRALRAGDVLFCISPPRDSQSGAETGLSRTVHPVPEFTHEWELRVLEGPHAAPEFFTDEGIAMLYASAWEVHFNSARTGVRLIGAQPSWARSDGGEAGLHPSNIHDTPYAFATIDFTGDTPILLGPDGPSLGGFVCPATVAIADRWKLGQLRPGDLVRFVPISEATADKLRNEHGLAIRAARAPALIHVDRVDALDNGLLGTREGDDTRPAVTYRRQGDDNVLVEYGPMTLDLGLRMRIQSLAGHLSNASIPGIIDLTPGIRSLQVHFDPEVLSLRTALAAVKEVEEVLPSTNELSVESRTVHLPLSWDDPATREATRRYMAGVRDDAPWCPWNIEFIRRINGLSSVDEVYEIVHAAEYLVLGLGDVYLGAPVATPLDPRHRLVTTKYNPARTWTPPNAVGIGGAYLCIYGMEGPGGYQFIGRTVPIWSRWHTRSPFEAGSPWLLRHFDKIRWFPVEADELLDMRADMTAGRLDIRIDAGTFALSDYEAGLERDQASIANFQDRQRAAFDAERERWQLAGEFDRVARLEARGDVAPKQTRAAHEGDELVPAPVTSSVWRIDTAPGQLVEQGDVLVTLEAMKLEVSVVAPRAGVIAEVLVRTGEQVPMGQPLVVIRAGRGD